MMGFQQPPKMPDNVPPEVQMLLMQPQAVSMLKQMKGFDLLSLYYFQMPFMLLQKDTQRIEKVGQKFLSTAGLGLLAGIILNVQIKRVSLNFLKLPLFVRLPIRLAIFAAPFGLLFPRIKEAGNEMQDILDNLENKKNKLIRTQDIEEYFEIERPKKQQNKK